MTGWIMRAVSSRNLENIPTFIAQTVLIFAGPPIYAAAEYNILGRLMHYLPMHALLNPSRVLYLFIYLGAAVEGLTAAGATLMSSATVGSSNYSSGGVLISVALVLQGVVECLFLSMVALLHHRCVRGRMLAPNVRMLCIMLYGTSSLVLLRCIFRAVQAFSMYTENCGSTIVVHSPMTSGICTCSKLYLWPCTPTGSTSSTRADTCLSSTSDILILTGRRSVWDPAGSTSGQRR